jgi:hypothetical protein
LRNPLWPSTPAIETHHWIAVVEGVLSISQTNAQAAMSASLEFAGQSSGVVAYAVEA